LPTYQNFPKLAEGRGIREEGRDERRKRRRWRWEEQRLVSCVLPLLVAPLDRGSTPRISCGGNICLFALRFLTLENGQWNTTPNCSTPSMYARHVKSN
jgi:hypothetical protein